MKTKKYIAIIEKNDKHYKMFYPEVPDLKPIEHFDIETLRKEGKDKLQDYINNMIDNLSYYDVSNNLEKFNDTLLEKYKKEDCMITTVEIDITDNRSFDFSILVHNLKKNAQNEKYIAKIKKEIYDIFKDDLTDGKFCYQLEIYPEPKMGCSVFCGHFRINNFGVAMLNRDLVIFKKENSIKDLQEKLCKLENSKFNKKTFIEKILGK